MLQDTILVVDDQAVNREILCSIFNDEYRVLQAEDGQAALDILSAERKRIAVILLDVIMPVMDGFGVIRAMSTDGDLKRIPVVLITGDRSDQTESTGFELGITDFITKPFNPSIVRRRVKNTINLYMYKNNLEDMVEQQTEKLREQADKLQKTTNQIIDTLSTVVEFRDVESGKHIKRIKKFTNAMAKAMVKRYPEYRYSEKDIAKITSASTLHDIGKIAIPDRILLKPARLLPDEFEIIKMHTTKGCDIIRTLDFIEDTDFYKYCYEICRYHHERYDGKGYPDGLSGDEIPFSAQCVSIADVYDALVSERIYKSAYSPEDAYEMIMNGECGVFSPGILECFSGLRTEFESMINE